MADAGRAPRSGFLQPLSGSVETAAWRGWSALDERGRTRVAIGAAVVLALGLRLPFLHTPLGVDEGGIAQVAQSWGSGTGSLYGGYWLDRPPLLVLLFKVALAAGDLGIRLLGAAAAATLVVLVAATARALAGDGAARIAALLGALFTGSVAMVAVFTPGELLAAVPAAASVLCLVMAHRRGHTRWLFSAGLLAVSAVLIKQSFLDAAAAGVVFLVASCVQDRRVEWRGAAAYGAGALVPLLAVALWETSPDVSAHGLVYALIGFRIDALNVLATADDPLSEHMARLLPAALGSGLLIALLATVPGLRRLRRDAVLLTTFGAWLMASAVGVLGGGSYWPHYLIQVAPACSVLAACGLASASARVRRPILTSVVAIAITVTAIGGIAAVAGEPRQRELTVAEYVRSHARPGDTQYVLYARANLGYYTGLPSPYPYAWSLMVRTVPGAPDRLRRLLASSRRPTWVIQWQAPRAWNLDPGRRLARTILTNYRQVATVWGHRVFLRRDRALERVRPQPPRWGSERSSG